MCKPSTASVAPSETLAMRTEEVEDFLSLAPGGSAPRRSIGFEHSRENFARGGFSVPHEPQRRVNDEAHSMQNLAPSGFSELQVGQCITQP
jgi:hypothetical protein